ncbi:hypothetical protein MRX96_031735 [Rhipicephalus microplus]
MVLYSASVILLAIRTSTAQDAGVPVTTSSQLADALYRLFLVTFRCHLFASTSLRRLQGEFLFGPCGDLFPDFPANVLYFNGENCIIASVVLFGARQCMMGVTKEFKDSVPEECTRQFDQHCGPKRYTLYSKEECTLKNFVFCYLAAPVHALVPAAVM